MDPRQRRIQVWERTTEHYRGQPAKRSTVYDMSPGAVPAKPPTAPPLFFQEDCIDVAVRMKAAGHKPLLLNMASDYVAGGGVRKGASAQEEELYRRSNYHKYDDRRNYPFPTYRTIYSAAVEFWLDGNYEPLPQPITLDCIAVAGLRKPELSRDGRRLLKKEDVTVLEQKIRILCDVAVKHGNDCLVLSALGCGAFENPPEHVARIFKRVLDEVGGHFKVVVFAILGYNYDVFKKNYVG